jgi:hypothetical protein
LIFQAICNVSEIYELQYVTEKNVFLFLEERDHAEDLSIGGRILEWMRENEGEGVDWMHLALRKEQWPYLLNTVMKGMECLD